MAQCTDQEVGFKSDGENAAPFITSSLAFVIGDF